MVEVALDRSTTFLANRQEFLVGCLWSQLSLVIDVADMLADVLLCRLEQIGHKRLRQPDGLIRQPHVDLDAPVFGRVDQELPPGPVVRWLVLLHRASSQISIKRCRAQDCTSPGIDQFPRPFDVGTHVGVAHSRVFHQIDATPKQAFQLGSEAEPAAPARPVNADDAATSSTAVRSAH